MRHLTLAAVLLCPALAAAGPPPAAQARAAQALAAARKARPPQSVIASRKPKCACGKDCACVPGKRDGCCACPENNCPCSQLVRKPTLASACPCGCGCKGCACEDADCGPACTCCPERDREQARFRAAAARAVRESKPLLLWVRVCCPPCQAKMPGYVHCCVTEYEGYSGTETDCCVLVFRPDGTGGMVKAAKLPGIPTVEQVKDALAAKAKPAPAPVAYLPPPMPMMMPMFGGFGGGMMGGFGGGGGGC